ncbi:TIGR02466 family protein [Allorhizobium pseudoryzae]|uniref:TIGR02466 family protein n=1 Tax=Allorhizobium pseudoryzae TaxID=379684 RepID=UPI003CFE3C78
MANMHGLKLGLNPLFCVPVAKFEWRGANRFNSHVLSSLGALDIGLVRGNRLKMENGVPINQIGETWIAQFNDFVLEHADMLLRSILGVDVMQALANHRSMAGASFRDASASAVDERFSSHSLSVSSQWLNVYRAGQFHPPHTHPGALLAAVYCVTLPDDCRAPEGSLAFSDPRAQALNHAPGLSIASEGVDVLCRLEPGELVVFPGWLGHYVIPHTSSKERVTVSLNLGFAPSQEG